MSAMPTWQLSHALPGGLAPSLFDDVESSFQAMAAVPAPEAVVLQASNHDPRSDADLACERFDVMIACQPGEP